MKAAFPSPPCHSAAQLRLSGRKHTSWEGLSKRLLGREEGAFYSTFLLHAARSPGRGVTLKMEAALLSREVQTTLWGGQATCGRLVSAPL